MNPSFEGGRFSFKNGFEAVPSAEKGLIYRESLDLMPEVAMMPEITLIELTFLPRVRILHWNSAQAVQAFSHRSRTGLHPRSAFPARTITSSSILTPNFVEI